MSITGTGAYFVEEDPGDLARVVGDLFALLETRGENRVSALARAPTPVRVRRGVPVTDAREFERPNPMSLVGTNMTAAAIADAARVHPYLLVSFRQHRSFDLYEGVIREVPPAIRGDVSYFHITLKIGPMDWYQDGHAEDPEVCDYYWGRSQFAVSLFYYGCPSDWEAFRRAIFEVPEFRALQAKIEAILGPVKRCITWSV
jgi:hypothetical protein